MLHKFVGCAERATSITNLDHSITNLKHSVKKHRIVL